MAAVLRAVRDSCQQQKAEESMEGQQEQSKPSIEGQQRPHILAMPLPLVGHMTPMVQLCNILVAAAGCRVTLVCSDRCVHRLNQLVLQHSSSTHRHMQVLAISDGMPAEPPAPVTWEYHREQLHQIMDGDGGLSRSFAAHMHSFHDVACIISDVYLSWTQDVANRLCVPRLALWTSVPAEYQVYFHAKELVKAGTLPFKAPCDKENDIQNLIPSWVGRCPIYHQVREIDDNHEEEIKVDGLPGLRRKDLPCFLQIEDSSDEFFYMFIENVQNGLQASMVLFNMFEALDVNVLNALKLQGLPAHCIGPLFLLEDEIMKEQVLDVTDNGPDGNANVMQKYDDGCEECLEWLDRQDANSVLYVAFGTMVHISDAEAKEIATGLLQSKRPFVWVYPKRSEDRDGSARKAFVEAFLKEAAAAQGSGIDGDGDGDSGRLGWVLEWAPQKHILQHPSIGAFLTHCGWNSTTEAICFGVPLLCLPFSGDQSLDCKMITEVWKVGWQLERKGRLHAGTEGPIAMARDICERVQAMLHSEGGQELRMRAVKLKEAASAAVQPGGSSRVVLHAIIHLVLHAA